MRRAIERAGLFRCPTSRACPVLERPVEVSIRDSAGPVRADSAPDRLIGALPSPPVFSAAPAAERVGPSSTPTGDAGPASDSPGPQADGSMRRAAVARVVAARRTGAWRSGAR